MAAASADVTTRKTSNSIKSSQRAVHCARSARSSHSMIWKQRRKSSVTQVATYRKPLRHESALVAKAPVHRQRVAVPKVLDDHVQHPALPSMNAHENREPWTLLPTGFAAGEPLLAPELIELFVLRNSLGVRAVLDLHPRRRATREVVGRLPGLGDDSFKVARST